jgi:hypothetical protein
VQARGKNKKSWQFGFMNNANTHKSIMNNFNKLIEYLNRNILLSYSEFHNKVIELFGSNWENDVEDIAYLINTLFYDKVKLMKNINGTISKIEIINRINKLKNFNNFIIEYFGEDLIRNKLRSEE